MQTEQIIDQFKIKSFGLLSPFITTLLDVCIDQRKKVIFNSLFLAVKENSISI